MGKISRSLRYVIDIIEMDPLYLEELGGGGVNSEKNIFNLRRSNRIFIKLHI